MKLKTHTGLKKELKLNMENFTLKKLAKTIY